jgi:hypothetical protein
MSEELIKLIKQKIWCVFPFVSISIDNDYSRYEIKIVMHFYYKDSYCSHTQIISKQIFDCCTDDTIGHVCDEISKNCINYIIDTMEDKDV